MELTLEHERTGLEHYFSNQRGHLEGKLKRRDG